MDINNYLSRNVFERLYNTETNASKMQRYGILPQEWNGPRFVGHSPHRFLPSKIPQYSGIRTPSPFKSYTCAPRKHPLVRRSPQSVVITSADSPDLMSPPARPTRIPTAKANLVFAPKKTSSSVSSKATRIPRSPAIKTKISKSSTSAPIAHAPSKRTTRVNTATRTRTPSHKANVPSPVTIDVASEAIEIAPEATEIHMAQSLDSQEGSISWSVQHADEIELLDTGDNNSFPTLKEVQELFYRLDTDKSGKLSISEMDHHMDKLYPELPNKSLAILAYSTLSESDGCDLNINDFPFFLLFLLYFSNLWEEFVFFDDEDLRISRREFQSVAGKLGLFADEADANETFVELDREGTGFVRYDSFCATCARRRLELTWLPQIESDVLENGEESQDLLDHLLRTKLTEDTEDTGEKMNSPDRLENELSCASNHSAQANDRGVSSSFDSTEDVRLQTVQSNPLHTASDEDQSSPEQEVVISAVLSATSSFESVQPEIAADFSNTVSNTFSEEGEDDCNNSADQDLLDHLLGTKLTEDSDETAEKVGILNQFENNAVFESKESMGDIDMEISHSSVDVTVSHSSVDVTDAVGAPSLDTVERLRQNWSKQSVTSSYHAANRAGFQSHLAALTYSMTTVSSNNKDEIAEDISENPSQDLLDRLLRTNLTEDTELTDKMKSADRLAKEPSFESEEKVPLFDGKPSCRGFVARPEVVQVRSSESILSDINVGSFPSLSTCNPVNSRLIIGKKIDERVEEVQLQVATLSQSKGTNATHKVQILASVVPKGSDSIAIDLPPETELLAHFDSIDVNGKGMLWLAQLDKYIQQNRPEWNRGSAVKQACRMADEDGDGFVLRNEFPTFVKFVACYNRIWDELKLSDMERGDRRVSREEVYVLGQRFSFVDVDAILEGISQNSGNVLLFDDLCGLCVQHYMKPNSFDDVMDSDDETAESSNYFLKAIQDRHGVPQQRDNLIGLPSREEMFRIFDELDIEGKRKLDLDELDHFILNRHPEWYRRAAILRGFQLADPKGRGFVKRKRFPKFYEFIAYYSKFVESFKATDGDSRRSIHKDEFVMVARQLGVQI